MTAFIYLIAGFFHVIAYKLAFWASMVFLWIIYVIILILMLAACGIGLLLLIETIVAKLSKEKKII